MGAYRNAPIVFDVASRMFAGVGELGRTVPWCVRNREPSHQRSRLRSKTSVSQKKSGAGY